MTDKEVEYIIRSNMNLQMNLAGIRQDFEEKLQRTWVGLTNDEVNNLAAGCHLGNSVQDAIYKAVAKLKEKNT